MSVDHSFSSDLRAEQVSTLAREILGESHVVISVISLKFTENFETTRAMLDARLIEISDGKPKKKSIQGEGVGLVDACFDAVIKSYNGQFCSLDTISIVDFTISSHVGHGSHRQSDAKVTALLRVKNSQNHEYGFECTTSSISHSSVAAVQESAAFFINAELAYTRLHYALRDAKDRGRHDLVVRYENQMSTLVNATSYEKLVASLSAR